MKVEINEKELRVKITSEDGGYIEKQSVEVVLLAKLLQTLESIEFYVSNSGEWKLH